MGRKRQNELQESRMKDETAMGRESRWEWRRNGRARGRLQEQAEDRRRDKKV